MTDFTKEELTYIIDAIDNNIECFNEPDIAYFVRDKLKSMIDNYEKLTNNKTNNIMYVFEFPENGCGGFDVSRVNLMEVDKSVNSGAGVLDYAYNTKLEAINAMKKRLDEIND